MPDPKVGLPPMPPGYPILLEWMVRDGDDALVDMREVARTLHWVIAGGESGPKARPYRPASHWRAEIARIDAALKAESEKTRLCTTDMAAYGGIGVRRTPRQQRQEGAAMDTSVSRTAWLMVCRARVAVMLARAEKRETPCP